MTCSKSKALNTEPIRDRGVSQGTPLYYYLLLLTDNANDLLTMNYHKWVVNAFLLPKNIYEIVHGHFC